MGATRSIVVLGHGFTDAGALPVPTPLLLVVAAAVAAAATRVSPRTDVAPPAVADTIPRSAAAVLRVLVSVVFLAVAAVAAFGARDVAANPAGRLLFTVGWAGVLVASAVVGSWWAHANPLRWLTDDDRDGAREWGVWPAAAAVAGFGAVEQLATPTPLVALTMLGVYVLAVGAGAMAYGDAWFRMADPVQTASSALGALAPVARRDGRVTWRSPRAGVRGLAAPPGLAAFLGALVGTGLFDAAHGDAGTWPAFVAWVAGAAVAFWAVARPPALAAALVPAAAAHVGAHYLAPLLIDTQVAAVQASDPFDSGWDLLGLTGQEIVAEPIPPIAGLLVQLVVLLAGHALAMVAASDVATKVLPPRAARAALFPLRAVVVASLLAGVYYWVGA